MELERGRLTDELSKLASVEIIGCDYCLNNEIDEVTLPEFTYTGSALGPFTVKNAVVSRCPQCGLMYYSRSESARWEVGKALELALRGSLEGPTEFRFMREVLDLTISELATMLAVDKSTVSRWESGKISPPPAAGKLLCLLFMDQVTGNLLSEYRTTHNRSVLESLLKIYSMKGVVNMLVTDIVKAVQAAVV